MIGIDILEIKRLKNIEKNEKSMERLFTKNEQNYFASFQNPLERIAGCFCAKESVMKAFKQCKDISFLDIEVLHDSCGAPYVVLYNKAKKLFDEKGCENIEISISHSKTVACAMCNIL